MEKCTYPLRPDGRWFPVEEADNDLLFVLFLSTVSPCESSDARVSCDVLRIASFAKLPVKLESVFCCCLGENKLSIKKKQFLPSNPYPLEMQTPK